MSEAYDDKAQKLRAQQLSALQQELAASLQRRFAANLEALKRYDPALAARFAHYQLRRKLEFFCTENGQANVLFTVENDFFYKSEAPCDYCAAQVKEKLESFRLQSYKFSQGRDFIGQINHRYTGQMIRELDKIRFEAQSPAELKSLPNCVMLGCGLGYQLGYLYASVEVCNLILIEPDEDLFFASLHAFDWASLLSYLQENHFTLHFLVGTNPEDLFWDLLSCYAKRGRFLSGLSYNFVHYASPQIDRCLAVLEQNRTMFMAMLGFFDDQLFGVSHALQAVASHKHFVRGDVDLAEEVRDLPWFVVGNGPSLDQDIAFLRKFQDKALIVACGTALETLYHAGIQPDFYGCTERTPEIASTIEVIPDKQFLSRIILLSGEVVHPWVQQYFAQTAIFLKREESFYALARQKIPGAERLRTITMMNPMVGNLGAAAGAFLRFKRIYLFGVDNGMKVGAERAHSQFNRLYGQYPDRDTAAFYQLTKLQRGNFGEYCSTNQLYLLSARTNEELVKYARAQNFGTEFFNCSDGLYMQGFTPVHSGSLRDQFDSLKNIDKVMVHNFFARRLTMSLQLERRKLPELLGVSTFEHLCDELTQLLSQPVQSRVGAVQLMSEASVVLYRLREQGDNFIPNYLEGSLQYMFIVMLTMLYHSADEQRCLEKFRLCQSLLGHFLADARKLYALQPEYIMGPHQKLLSGKVGQDYPDSKAPACPRLMQLVGKNYHDEQEHFIKQYQ